MAAVKMRKTREENCAFQSNWIEEHLFICIKDSNVCIKIYLFPKNKTLKATMTQNTSLLIRIQGPLRSGKLTLLRKSIVQRQNRSKEHITLKTLQCVLVVQFLKLQHKKIKPSGNREIIGEYWEALGDVSSPDK
jgi:hypothetical protein